MNRFDAYFFGKYVSEGEDVLVVCHRHSILILDRLIAWLFLAGILPVFFYLQSQSVNIALIPIVYFEIYLFVLYLYLMYMVFDWYNDVWILTETGMIELDWQMFKRKVSQIEYADIRNVSYEQSGFFDRFFGKGDIIVSLGEDDEIVLDDAQSPEVVVGIIQEILLQMDSAKRAVKKQEYETVLDALKEVVRQHLIDKNGSLEPEEVENVDEYNEEKALLNEALEKPGTIDLRGTM